MPEIPNLHAAAMLALTGLALFLFTRERLPLELSSLAILVVLTVGLELFPFGTGAEQFEPISLFSGFGHEALIAVCALMIVGQGLVTTGALTRLGRGMARLWKTRPKLSMLLTLVVGAIFSAFVNNTPIVVLLIPILVTAAHRNNKSPAPWLLPMNFSTLLGGTCTTIGTSTNLLVVGVAVDLGLQRFDMFDFALPGVIAAIVGIAYLTFIAPLFFSRRDAVLKNEFERTFVAQLQFHEGSSSIGATVTELNAKADDRLRILKIRKAADGYTDAGTLPLPDAKIAAEDRITISGTAEQLKAYEEVLDAVYYREAPEEEKVQEAMQLAEAVLLEGSRFVNRSLAETRFADTYQVVVLAIHRAARVITALPEGLGKVTLRVGDVLLVQGPREKIDELKSTGQVLVLDERQDLPKSGRGPAAIAILAAVVGAAALGILPIAISAVAGVLVMLLTGCISWRDVQSALSVPVIMIVVVSLALGSALTETGATDYIAQVFLYAMRDASATTVLAGLILLMAVVTNIVSNNAAAVIGTPVAISISSQLGAPPEAFVLAVLFGANLSFGTPMAYKTNVLVMSAGGYSFADFVRVGAPLTLLLWATYSAVLPRLYNL